MIIEKSRKAKWLSLTSGSQKVPAEFIILIFPGTALSGQIAQNTALLVTLIIVKYIAV